MNNVEKTITFIVMALVILCFIIITVGCARGPKVRDAWAHYVQAQLLCERCKDGECSAEATEDACASAEQACVIAALARKTNGHECLPQ